MWDTIHKTGGEMQVILNIVEHVVDIYIFVFAGISPDKSFSGREGVGVGVNRVRVQVRDLGAARVLPCALLYNERGEEFHLHAVAPRSPVLQLLLGA